MLKKLTLFLRWRKYNNNNNNNNKIYIFWQTTREESLSFVERKVCNVIKSSNKFQEIILKKTYVEELINLTSTFSQHFLIFFIPLFSCSVIFSETINLHR